MSRNSHRDNADTERTAAAATKLPNVRARHLRSAEAHDAVADREERGSASYKAREAQAAERKADKADDDDRDDTGTRLAQN